MLDSRPTDYGKDREEDGRNITQLLPAPWIPAQPTAEMTRKKTMKKTERKKNKKFLFRIFPTHIFEINKFSLTQKIKDTKNFLFIEKNLKVFLRVFDKESKGENIPNF